MNDIMRGVLGGLVEEHAKNQQNLLTQEMDRRKQLAGFWKDNAERETDHPEARDIAMHKRMLILQTPAGKKLPKEAESIDDWLNVQPKKGQSIPSGPQQQFGEQTIEHAPMTTPGGDTTTLPPTTLPPYMLEAPTPPPGYTVPHGFTQDELLGQADARATAEARAKGRYETSPEALNSYRQREKIKTDEAIRQGAPALESLDAQRKATEEQNRLNAVATKADKEADNARQAARDAQIALDAKLGRENALKIAGMPARAAASATGSGIEMSAPGTDPRAIAAKYPPEVQSLAQSLLHYAIPWPVGVAVSKPAFLDAQQLARELDPMWTSSDYQTRMAVKKDFTSGPTSKGITSLNTVVGHLGTLAQSGSALNNTWSPSYNSLANFLVDRAGDPRVKKFNQDKTAVIDEMTRAFRGTGGTEADINRWEAGLDAAGSPSQLDTVIKGGVELLASRLSALDDQWQRLFGTPPPFNLLSQKSVSTLKKLGVENMMGNNDVPKAPPTDKAPAGVDQALWDVLTPEEKAVWRK